MCVCVCMCVGLIIHLLNDFLHGGNAESIKLPKRLMNQFTGEWIESLTIQPLKWVTALQEWRLEQPTCSPALPEAA